MTFSPLPSSRLYTPCPVDRLTFDTTDDLKPLAVMIGQDRAVEAVRFAMGMKGGGYNLFALGPEGTGKATLVHRYLEEISTTRPVPNDWCYVNNFDEPQKPVALQLSPGHGRALRDDMDRMIEELRSVIPAAFESDDYRQRKDAIEEEFKTHREDAFDKLQQEAADNDIALIRTPMGLALTPMAKGEILSPDAFQALPEKEQKKRKEQMGLLQQKMEDTLRGIPKLEKEERQKIRDLNRDVTALAVDHLIEDLKKTWSDYKSVITYLGHVREDVLESADDFLHSSDQGVSGGEILLSMGRAPTKQSFRRYQVNLLVDNGDRRSGVPTIEEDHPTQPNLIGRIEHLSQFGTLVTDFTLIRAGALHRANGGYLVLDVRRLLMQPFAWETLMRTLRASHIRVESPYEALGFASSQSLEPEPIPLDVKVILIGEPIYYYLLSRFDPDFRELFKVAADFNTEIDRTEDAAMQYARLIASETKKEKLPPLTRDAVARVIEHGARLAGDSEKLTAHMASVVDLVREAAFWSEEANKKIIDTEDINRAIDAKVYRSDRIREYIQEEIQRGTLLIETEGARTGQVNGLSVIQLDDFSFGRPSRISCTARLGKGDVIDIERQVELGGPLHAKGVMILANFLGARYARETPLSLYAALVFEQSYSGVEGDSASSAELYALLSALADIPIKQSLAVTGSVDQMGRVQAIGGVNEKIEGFFDICQSRGLDGSHGVLIPETNVKHLMLRRDVVDAAERGDFHIHAVSTIDEGIEILTGVQAGVRDEKTDDYPIGSVNRAVEIQLNKFTKKTREAARATLPTEARSPQWQR